MFREGHAQRHTEGRWNSAMTALNRHISAFGIWVALAVLPLPAQQAKSRESTGLVPLTQMTAMDRYKGEDGGLYGNGQNDPAGSAPVPLPRPKLAKIVFLDGDGKPAKDGIIGFVSISMSNATQEFSVFKQLADADRQKSSTADHRRLRQGGQAMAQWVDPNARPWLEADRRLMQPRCRPNKCKRRGSS